MRSLRVDMIGLIDAVDSGPGTTWYLDLQSGRVDPDLEDLGFSDDPEEEDPFADSDRYAPVPETRQNYGWMEELAEGIEDPDVRDRFLDAISAKGAFRRFKDLLSRFPDVRVQWEVLRRERCLEILLPWLGELQIEPVYELPQIADATPQAPAREPAVDLLDLLLLGAPAGKPEIVEGRARRTVHLDDADRARRAFIDLRRQICAFEGVEWRKRSCEGKSSFKMGRMHLHVEGERVWLEVEVASDARFG
jgi:hypothetical protein